MNSKTLALVAISSLTLFACKREEDVAPTPANPVPTTGTVNLSFDLSVGTDALDMSSAYQDGAGHAIKFTKVKFYVSNVHLTDDNDNVLGHYEDTYILVDASNVNNTFTLGSLSPAEVHGAEITLGLGPDVNNSDPLTMEAPLNDPDMMWAWSTMAGRMFLKLEGRVDGNNDGDVEDVEDLDFAYHCLNLNNDLLREIHVHLHADVTAGSTSTLGAKVDLGVVVSGLDLLMNPEAMDGGSQCVVAMDSLATSISGVD